MSCRGMPKPKFPGKRDYERMYAAVRCAVDIGMNELSDRDGIGVMAANVQAECLVRTIKGIAYRCVPREERAEYLHWLFSMMMADCLENQKGLTGRVIVVEKSKKKSIRR